MPDKIKTLYDNLVTEGYDLPDFNTFTSDMTDINKRQKFHGSLVSEGYDLPDFETFTLDMGFAEKKKFKVEDFNKKYGTSYTEQEFGVKKPSQSKSTSQSTTTQVTTTTPQPKKISVGEETIKLKENNLREQESLFKSFEPKIAELNAAMQPYNELAKQNGGTLPPEEFAQYQQLYNESRKLSNEYKLAYNGYQQAFNEYKGEIGKFNASIEAGKKETEAQKVKRLGEEKAKVEKLGKTNPLGRIKLYTQTIDNINQKIPFLVEEYNKAEQAGDEAAMQKIELEIDKQQANIDYMTKAIEGQKKLGAMQVEDNLVNSFNVGLYRVIGKSMQVKKDLDESLVRLINDVTGVDQKFTDTYFKHIYKDKSPLSDKFAEAGKYIQKKAEEKGELKNLNRKYGASAWNAMEKGDVPTAIEYAFKDFIGFLPASLMYQNAATAVTSSIGIVGDELEAAKERGKTPNSKTVLAGGIKAGLEIATERWLGAGKATKQLIDRLGGDGAEQVVREVYEGVAKKSLGRKVAENVSEEVIGENINLLGSNAVDIFINETKEPDQLFEGIGDNTLVSIFGGGVQSTVTTTASHYIDRAKLKEAEAAKAKAQSLQEQALEAESPVVAEAIEKEAEKLNDWADEVIDWNNEIGANSDPEIIAEIESNNDKIDELEATIAESTPEIAEILTVQLQEIESANVELVKTAEQIALERLESILNERKPIEQPSVEFEQPSVNLSVKENPFKESLRKLGYEDSDIDKMTMEQMQEIVTNKTEAPIVESTAKVDSVKENKKQERLAEMNKELDEKITQDEPTIIESRTPKGDKGVEVAKPTIQTSTEEVVSSSEPSKADKSYKEAQEVNTVVSKENPNASVLIQPKGEDLSLTAVYVGKENRGKGIGTKVLESVKKQADKLGKKVILDATNELDSETDLERLGKFYEKNGFVKVGDNKYEYDPKNEDSSGDISTRNDNSRTKEQGISGVNDKGKPDKKPTTSTEEVVKEQATEGPKSVVSKKETTAKEQEIEGVDNTKKYIENLANDNYLFTHVTTEDNARSITNGGMNVSLGTGISSTLTQLGSEGTNSQIERLANGEIVHRDKNNNSVAVIAVPKSELDAMQGSSLAEKFENWLVENNKINEKGQLAIPSEFNAGYFNGKNFVTKSNPKQNTNEKTNEKVEPTKDKAVTEVSSEDSGENQKTEPKAVSEKGAEVETKAEKKAKVEKSIDDIAERLKKKFAITTLPQGTKTSGFSQEDLIDLVAKVAKEIAKTGIDITEAVKQVIADLRENGDLEGFDEVDIEAKSNEKASAKEEVKEEGTEKEFTKNTRRHFKTIANNKTLDTIVSKLNEVDFEYNVREMEVDTQVALDYIEKVGIEQALMDFKDNAFSEPMAESQKIALSSLLYAALNKGIELSLEEGDTESANLLYRESESLVKAVANYGTEAGRAINAFKNFAIDMSNPITAVFHAQKLTEKMNQMARESEANKSNADAIAKDINEKVEKGKRKTAKKVADILDKELYGAVTKGVKKDATSATRKKVSDFFDSLLADENTPLMATIIPITPKMYNTFVKGVKALVLSGVDLGIAMTRVSAQMVKDKEGSPKELAEARKTFKEKVEGIKEKKPLTDKQKERKAASEDLKEATKEYNAEKEIADYKEKQQKKAETLREKDAKKVLENVEKLELQRAQQQAKEAADLQDELAKERQRIADLKAKEATDLADKIAKLELQRAQQRLKEIEKAIKDLVSEIPKTNEDLAMELVDEYIKLEAGEKVSNETLVNMVKDKLGVSDAQAKNIATEIAKGVKDNIKSKLESKYARTIKEETTKEAKTPEQLLNEMVRDSVMGELVGAKILGEYFAKKYGVTDFTLEDAQKVKEVAKEIAQANTPERKAEKMAKMRDLLAEKNPVYFADLMDEMWYFAHLSSVLTLVGGTADTNNTYNLMQLWANTLEMPLTSILGAIRQGELGGVVNNIMLGFGNALFQTMEVSEKEKRGMDLFLDVITKSKGNLLNESFTYLQEAIQNGLSPFQEYEKPFENLRQGEFDINKYFRDAREGDSVAKLKIAKMAASVINSAYRGVPRVLGASDLFFGSIVKNAYVPIVLREQFAKEGYKGKELESKVLEAMLVNSIDKENAVDKAVKNRLSQDITYNVEVKDNKPVWTILDKGKVVTKGVLSKAPMEFETKEDAESFAREKVAPSGTQFKRDVRYYLNERIGDAAMKTAGKIAQRDLLSGKTEATAAQFDRIIGGVTRWSTQAEKFFGDAAKSRNSVEYLAILKMVREGDYKESATAVADKIVAGANRFLSVISKYISHLVAFRRVAINLARKTSGYTPLGFLRYKRSFSNKGALGGKYAEELTNTERDKILSQAILGTIGLAIMAKGFKEAARAAFDGDDEEEDSKKTAIKKYFEKNTGEPMPQKAVDFIYNLRAGDIIGSLEFLPRNERQYYNRTGIIKENSIFEGVNEKGDYVYNSILGDPKYASALMIGTYQNYMALADPEEKTKVGGVGYAIYQPISSFFDMSIGQGVGKQFSTNKSVKEKMETLAQTMLLDVLEVLNPDIIKKPLQYLDARLRPNQNLFDFIERTESVAGGLKEWTFNKITPVYGAYYSATQAPQAYGMFGEELYKLPAQGQGALSDAMFNYLYSDKNKEYKAMYDWLGANGFKSLWRAPKEVAVYTQEGTIKKLKIEEIEEYGRKAGQKSFNEISDRMAELQELRLTSGEDAFKREVSKIMTTNFKQTYYLGEGIINEEESKKLDEKRFERDKAKLEKRKIEAETKAVIDEAIGVTEEEKVIRDAIKTDYDVISYVKKKKTKQEQSDFMYRLLEIRAISPETFRNVRETLGID